MENQNKKVNFWKWTTLLLLVILVASCVYLFKNNKINLTTAATSNTNVAVEADAAENQNVNAEPSAQQAAREQNELISERITSSPALKYQDTEDPLSLWSESSKLKTELTDYLARITAENSPDFIPKDNRIAVFDFDGTLFCETNPVYMDHRLLYHRVVEDETYKDKASDFEKEVAEKIKVYMETGKADENLPMEHGKSVASAFKGMTQEELISYIKDYLNNDEPNYTNKKMKDGYYQPMVQVVDLLNKNGFTVYVVSGTDRFLTRAFVEGSLNLPPRQVIGSDDLLVATGQGDTDGLDYQLTKEDKVVLEGEFQIKNLKMNKVKVIEREIGVQPVLSFGNTSGDYSMAMYTTSGNKYLSKAYMLCCDDLERENGNEEKAQDMFKKCDAEGWTPISMKDDFLTIYGYDVEYLKD
jgi:phosphoglycolate phosphatase-like HAD superfamily hydrolase